MNCTLPEKFLCFSNIFSFVCFFLNIQLYLFLVIQKDKPERHEKVEKKTPPKGIYFSFPPSLFLLSFLLSSPSFLLFNVFFKFINLNS